MLPTDRPMFMKVLNGMAAMKKTTLIPEVLDLWWGCMADWSIDDFKAAAILVLKRTDFMPNPKDFEDLRRAGRATAGEAWNEARKHLVWGLQGYTLHADCPPRIAKTVRMLGGANVIAMCDESKLTFLERRFTEHFESLDDASEVREAVPQIAQSVVPRVTDLTRRLTS